jgi:hypothetical protein
MINRTILLNTLVKHETMTIDDLQREENMGMVFNRQQLWYLLRSLQNDGFITILHGAEPCTYTVTTAGIERAMGSYEARTI